ncbi:hypothetical protein Angca_002034, partial [Angiostrongylus cantonensis]
FCSAVLPQSSHQRAFRPKLWSHDKIYNIILPAHSIPNAKDEFRYVHVDFALGDDNSSLDCWSYSTLEDIYHRPIHITANSGASSVSSEIAQISSHADSSNFEHLFQEDNTLEYTIPKQKHPSNVDQCNGSVLRALLDSAEGLSPPVEPITISKRFMLRRTRRSKRFLIKST